MTSFCCLKKKPGKLLSALSCTFLSVFLLHLAKNNSLDNTTFFVLYNLFEKRFFAEIAARCLFFCLFFFFGCFAKVFLCQRVNKNYCGSNTKLKCFCILVFSFFGTCYPYFFLFWNVLSRRFSSCFFFFSFFSEHKAKTCEQKELLLNNHKKNG